jgi:DNA polymerase (family 10)
MAPEELLEVQGIGKGLVAHVAELGKSGTLADLEALRKRFPKGLLELTQVEGLGPKRAKLLFETLKIGSLKDLAAAAQAGKLAGLPGIGEKLAAKIARGLSFAQEAKKRMLYWDAKLVMEELVAAMKPCPGVTRLAPAGSLRRGRETVGDLDLLCAARDAAKAVEFFTRLPQVERVLGAGPTKATVWLKAGIQCDLRAVPAASFGAALLYFTGSKDHNVVLRERALKKGLTVNEYGLYRLSDKRHAKPLAGRAEEEIYAALGLAYVPPELRENRGEIEAAAGGTLPELATLKDVRGDFHNHSDLTDGSDSLETMARAARDQGWEWVALGDHSRGLRVAHGLEVADLRRSIAEVRALQKKVPGIRLMRSMEVEILKDGSIDYPDEVLDEIDVVIASVHSAFGQSEAEMTARVRRAAANPRVDIIGHLSGRLLNKREPYALDAEAVLAEGARGGAAFELNGQPQRQDLDDVRARRAKELGAALAVTTDAHAAAQLRYMESAVTIARRAWLAPADLLNAKSYGELKEWLERPRKG